MSTQTLLRSWTLDPATDTIGPYEQPPMYPASAYDRVKIEPQKQYTAEEISERGRIFASIRAALAR